MVVVRPWVTTIGLTFAIHPRGAFLTACVGVEALGRTSHRFKDSVASDAGRPSRYQWFADLANLPRTESK